MRFSSDKQKLSRFQEYIYSRSNNRPIDEASPSLGPRNRHSEASTSRNRDSFSEIIRTLAGEPHFFVQKVSLYDMSAPIIDVGYISLMRRLRKYT